MLRFLTGAGSATLLLLAGFFIWKGVASRAENPVPNAPVETASAADIPEVPGQPPSADARTREQRRFDRADRDNNGNVTLEEMTYQRRRNYQRLDANHDGVIDETEIANASAALKTLDKNGDGKLTMDELMGPRPPRGEGPGHPPGPPPSGAENGQTAPKDQ